MKAFIENTFEQQLKDLQALVSVPSVSRGEPKENMPYGENVENAWRVAERIAKDLGFEKVRNVEHRCGVIEYGEGEELVAVMAHLDVVPAGKGWTYPPFGAEIHDGKMYGRGVLDNKGAAVNALYALAAVKNSGIRMKRRVRILLGMDEETGCTGMTRYREVEGEPTMAFTPDAVYPVVNSEMNILHIKYKKAFPCTVRANVGTVINVIPGEAEAFLPGEAKAAPAEGFTVTAENNRLFVAGKGGHASMPDFAKNALQALFQALSAQELPAEEKKVFTVLSANLGLSGHGEAWGIDKTDESGRISFVPTLFTADESGMTLCFDSRYPFAYTYEELKGKLDAVMLPLGFVCEFSENTPGHFVSPQSELVTKLMQVYREQTGDTESGLISMGGGTYAKEFVNAVAFGTVFPGDTDRCHMPDEYVSLEEIKLNTLIMAKAISLLAGE